MRFVLSLLALLFAGAASAQDVHAHRARAALALASPTVAPVPTYAVSYGSVCGPSGCGVSYAPMHSAYQGGYGYSRPRLFPRLRGFR